MPKDSHHYQPWTNYSQREFRAKLASQLFERSERLSGRPASTRTSLSSRVHPALGRDHGGLERMNGKPKPCVVCLNTERKVSKQRALRKPLMELSANTVRPSTPELRKRRERAPRSQFGCRLCGIHICNHIVCWKEHIGAIPGGSIIQ